MSAAVRDSLVGQTIADKYLIESVLGAGGMGMVYRATQRLGKVERTVAVKVLRQALAHSPTAVERFLREVETTCQLQHPNIVRIFDFGQTDQGVLYMVMEHLVGRTLERLIAAGAPLPLAHTVHILTQVCDALAEAHGRGIIHRDVKPSNIFLVKQDRSSDVVKVLDFGIAKVPLVDGEPTLTQTGMLPGSPPYMCPEYIKGEPIDARADIYSIGCVCFEMLSGRRPYAGNKPIAVLTAHVEKPIPSVVELTTTVALPRSADDLIGRALAKHPGERFADVGELRQALQQLVREPTSKKLFGPAGQVTLAISPALAAARERALTDVQPRPRPVEDAVTQPEQAFDPGPTRPDVRIVPTGVQPASRLVLGVALAIAGVAVAGAIGLLAWPRATTAPATKAADAAVSEASPQLPPLVPVGPVEPPLAEGPRLSAEEIDGLIKAAREAIAADDFGAADAAVSKVLKADPSNETAKGLFEKAALERAAAEDVAAAEVDHKAGRPEDALAKLDAIPDKTQARVKALKRANEIREELAAEHEKAARAALESEDFEAARSEVEIGLKLVPQSRSLKEVLREIDNSEQVAITKAPHGKKPPTEKIKKPVTVAAKETRPAKGNPDEANRLYLEGNRLILQGRFKDAIDKFKQALVADYKFADGHRGLGIAYAKLSKNDLAVHHYELYLQLRPFAPDADRVRQIIKEYKATKGTN